jgi:phage shock protein B
MSPPMHAVAFGFITLILILLGGLAMSILGKIKEKGSSGRNREQIEETRMIQELHQKLLRMEERVEALETILLEHDEVKGERP